MEQGDRGSGRAGSGGGVRHEQAPDARGGADRSDLNGTLHHGSTIKFFKFSRNGTPAVTLDRNADLGALGDDYEEVDYNVEDILAVSCAPERQLFSSRNT